MLRRKFSFLLVMLSLLPIALSAQSKDEIEFRELLLDMSAFLKARSFSYNDYKARVAPVVIQLDRYKRRNGQNKNLIAAAEAFIEAKDYWDLKFAATEKNNLLEINRIQSEESLKSYFAERDRLDNQRESSWEKFQNEMTLYMNSSKKSTSKK